MRDLNKIQSEAYQKVEEIRGEADAKAAQIYSKAYDQNKASRDFNEFTRTMAAYSDIVNV